MSKLTSNDPYRPGWYATLHCWDVVEGAFPGAHYWDGLQWQPETKASIQHWPIVFKSEDLAADYAWEHDPDNQ